MTQDVLDLKSKPFNPDDSRRKAFLKAIGYTDEQAKEILSRENMGEYLDLVAECVMKQKFYGGSKGINPEAQGNKVDDAVRPRVIA